MRMEKNEFVARFIARVKDQKDILGDIEEKVSNSDLIAITLNEMKDEYHMFITGFSASVKTHAFEELKWILKKRLFCKCQNPCIWRAKRNPEEKCYKICECQNPCIWRAKRNPEEECYRIWHHKVTILLRWQRRSHTKGKNDMDRKALAFFRRYHLEVCLWVTMVTNMTLNVFIVGKLVI